MPTLSIYVTDDIFVHLFDQGTPSQVGKRWIEDRFIQETQTNDTEE